MHKITNDLEETQLDENSQAPSLPSSSIGSPMSEDNNGNERETFTPTQRGRYTPNDKSGDHEDDREDVTETFGRLAIDQSIPNAQDSSQIIGRD
jgi:hypothetical protein